LSLTLTGYPRGMTLIRAAKIADLQTAALEYGSRAGSDD
jgi:hypothetical protein